MGLFRNIFGGKNKKKIEHPGHKEDWDFYFTNVDNKLSPIAVDLGLVSVAPIQDQGNVYWISIKMLDPREDGLSSNGDSGILGDIEDQLAERMKTKYSATHGPIDF